MARRQRRYIIKESNEESESRIPALLKRAALIAIVGGLCYGLFFRGKWLMNKLSFAESTEDTAAIEELMKWSPSDRKELVAVSDEIIEAGNKEYALYLKKGDRLHISASTEGKTNFSLWNYEKGSKIKEYKQATEVSDEIEIPVSAIYYLLIESKEKQYHSVAMQKSSATEEDFNESWSVRSTVTRGLKATDKRVTKFETIEPTSLFYEPKQITLKKLFHLSGNNKSIVPVKIPAGVKNVIYRAEISTSRNARTARLHGEVENKVSDFIDNFSLKRQTARMIFDEINRPHTEKDCTVDIYVFDSDKYARAFQVWDTNAKWEKHYDVANSIMGTQSCNGLLDVAGKKIIYLGFMGTHSFDDTYLYLECEYLKPITDYVRRDYERE